MRVLHLLSQRPMLTGSGVTLDAIVGRAARAGLDQRVVVCAPDGAEVSVGGLEAADIAPLRFETGALPFAVPGMSDVMPYPSSRFSAMSAEEIEAYTAALATHITEAIADFGPDVIHAHHVWLMSALLGELAPDIPVVVHSHGTGLRQLELCPHLADRVLAGVAGVAHVAALSQEHAAEIRRRLQLPGDRVSVVGAGFRDDLFSAAGRAAHPGHIGYAGKLANAKGLPQLLDAVERLGDVTLHVAGGGAGPEAAAIEARLRACPVARYHGRLDQPGLAALLREVDVFCLPSFYEGLPLVLVEAFASGCRLVATDLPGTRELAPSLGGAVELVDRPRTDGPDRPLAADLPGFVAALADALERAVEAGPIAPDPAVLRGLGWDAVYERIGAIWRSVT